MALVQAHAEGNQVMIDDARQGLAALSTMDILSGLYQFGQVLSSVNLDEEQKKAIEEELVSGTSPEMTAAIQHVGRALLIAKSRLSSERSPHSPRPLIPTLLPF
jgi:hypothetical protein